LNNVKDLVKDDNFDFSLIFGGNLSMEQFYDYWVISLEWIDNNLLWAYEENDSLIVSLAPMYMRGTIV
jgi:hypothetical protein